jgi:hypothetical protein
MRKDRKLVVLGTLVGTRKREGTSRIGQRPVDLSGLVTSCSCGRHRCCGAARARGRRRGARDCHGDCRRSRPAVGPRWCSTHCGWAQDGS